MRLVLVSESFYKGPIGGEKSKKARGEDSEKLE